MRPIHSKLRVIVAHSTLCNAKLRGYNVPKNTLVIPALCEIHFDERHFPDPQRFHPDRFLDADGKFRPNPAMIAFGIGKRDCMGKNLAKQETFLFTACLLHQVLGWRV